jgi:hypothetical protein
MPGYLVLFFSLAIAFTWVEVVKIGKFKPLNCVKCLTGWISLPMAYFFETPYWYFYLFAGLFVGAVYSAIQMRYL